MIKWKWNEPPTKNEFVVMVAIWTIVMCAAIIWQPHFR